MKKNLKLNYLYNLIYQLTAVLLPLITMPYVARVLGGEGVGINSYTNANTQYFILLGTLGVSIYATKKIAMVRDQANELRKTVKEIFLLQFIGCVLVYFVFMLTLGSRTELALYYKLQGIFILASAIDISWYFIGIEDFKKASLRSFFVKLASVCLIFVFVKTSDDLWKYILINSVSIFVGQIIMWLYVDKEIFKKDKSLGKLNLFKHLSPIMIMFIPQISSQVYTVLDKTMTGLLSNTLEVGYYDQSQKIVRLLLTIVTSVGIVMLPRIANLHGKGAKDEIRGYLKKTFGIITFISVPLMFGIIAVSDRFIPMFFGDEYLPVVPLAKISAVMIVIIGLGNVFGTQYLLSTGKNKEYTASVVIGAIINLVLNLFLIPKYAAYGAVIATVTAESCIAVIQFIYSRKIFDISWLKESYKYWVSGIIMFIVVYYLNIDVFRRSISVVVEIGIGGLCYVGVLLLLKDKFFIETLTGVYNKIRKNS